jgi:hypothetical protein
MKRLATWMATVALVLAGLGDAAKAQSIGKWLCGAGGGSGGFDCTDVAGCPGQRCSPSSCDTDGQVMAWNETDECWDCLACGDGEFLQYDAGVGTWICVSGTSPFCAPEACDTDGQLLIWNEGSACIDCLACGDNQILRYDLATTTWVCDDIDNVALCDKPSCQDGSMLVYNSGTDCYDCLICADKELVRWEDATSSWTCVAPATPPLCDPTNNCDDDGDVLVWNDSNQCMECVECLVQGQVLSWDIPSDTWQCTTINNANVCVGASCDTDGQVVIWNEGSTCFDCLACGDQQFIQYDLATTTWVCVDRDAPLCDAATCDDNSILQYDLGNACFKCLVCTNDEEVLEWDVPTGEWQCATPAVPPLCDAAACVDNDLLQWNDASECFDCLNCGDGEILAYVVATTSWDCVKREELCNEATCTDNAILQYDDVAECFACLTCAPGQQLEWSGTDWTCVNDGEWCSGAEAACGGGMGVGDTDVDLFYNMASTCWECVERQLWRHQDDTYAALMSGGGLGWNVYARAGNAAFHFNAGTTPFPWNVDDGAEIFATSTPCIGCGTALDWAGDFDRGGILYLEAGAGDGTPENLEGAGVITSSMRARQAFIKWRVENPFSGGITALTLFENPQGQFGDHRIYTTEEDSTVLRFGGIDGNVHGINPTPPNGDVQVVWEFRGYAEASGFSGFSLPRANKAAFLPPADWISEHWFGYATDTDELMCWDGSAWQVCGGTGVAFSSGLWSAATNSVILSGSALPPSSCAVDITWQEADGSEEDLGVCDELEVQGKAWLLGSPQSLFADEFVAIGNDVTSVVVAAGTREAFLTVATENSLDDPFHTRAALAGAPGSNKWFAFRSTGTIAVPAAIGSNNQMLEIAAFGHDGTDFAKSAAIIFDSGAGAVGAGDVPGEIEFWTHEDNGPADTIRRQWYIDHNGDLIADGSSGDFDNLIILDSGVTGPTTSIGGSLLAGSNWVLRLPQNDGDPGECLKTNGSGVSSWQACGGSGLWSTGSFTQTYSSANNGKVGVTDGDIDETLSNAAFVWGAGDLFVENQLGVEDDIFTDGDLILGATTTLSDGSLTWSTGNFAFSTAGGGDLTLATGSLLLVNDRVGFGALTAAGAACISNDLADRLFHDTDCDGTQDPGENHIDILDTDTNTNAQTICGTGQFLDGDGNCVVLSTKARTISQHVSGEFRQLTDVETNPAPNTTVIGAVSKYAAANFDDTTRTYRNGQFVVNPDISATGSDVVTFRAYVRAATAATANVCLDFDWIAVNNDEDTDPAGYTTESSGAVASSTTQDHSTEVVWTETITNLGWQPGDLIIFRFSRDPACASDLTGNLYGLAYSIELP